MLRVPGNSTVENEKLWAIGTLRAQDLKPITIFKNCVCGKASFANPYLIPAVLTLSEQVLRLKPDEGAPRLEQTLVDLICLMLELGRDGGMPPMTRPELSSLLFNRICAFVQANLGRHDLTPEIAGSEHRISLRYLHKIFHANGLSFARCTAAARPSDDSDQ
jgi:hypothetical protein